tara:strand:- start:544 stop:2577 length:2034 start_codon:yes stop_codon:yes gene_type:complete
VVEIIDFRSENPDTLNLEYRTLPNLRKQRRKDKAKSSILDWKICGADTETIEGKCWLFSTEWGVWEVNSFESLLGVLYDPIHCRKWKQGKGKGKKNSRGYSTFEFFFWNLKFDCQSVLRYLPEEIVLNLINGIKQIYTVNNIDFELSYIEGKCFKISPKNWYRGQYKMGVCYWWDISQFYGKQKLKSAGEKYLGETKIEYCFDGSILDVTKFDSAHYRDYYREDIEKYALQDAILAGKLTRLKREEYISQNVRFIKPYSLANIAQRNCLDMCDIPTINDYFDNPILCYDDKLSILQKSLSCYQGGWFECIGSGFRKGCIGIDLASAYPYIMYHLPDISKGHWVFGDETESWWSWCEDRKPYSLGYAEAFIVFDEGLPYYPLLKKSETGTMMNPRIVQGWFTADELVEARKWPHSTFVVGEWMRFTEDDESVRPYRNFISKFYEIKMNSDKDSVEYKVAKQLLNSIYGKTIQATNNSAGKLYNPMYASVICGGTRARLAELIRLNNFKALSVATDGIIFEKDDLKIIPDRPLEAPFNLGNWELEEEGDLVIIMSGVYSMKNPDFVKTTFRGSASYHLRNYANQGGLFRFCEEFSSKRKVTTTYKRPYSAKEARVRNDLNLMNQFEEMKFSFSALGDSKKRLWLEQIPITFGDLLNRWFTSTPHRELEKPSTLGVNYDE